MLDNKNRDVRKIFSYDLQVNLFRFASSSGSVQDKSKNKI